MNMLENEVLIKGRSAGMNGWYAFNLYVPLGIIVLGSIFVNALIGITIVLWILGFASFFVFRSVFKRSVAYDPEEKKIVLNKKSHLKFAKKEISLADVKSVRIRYVKIGFTYARFSLNSTGKYYVYALDSDDAKKSMYIWFNKKDGADKFYKILEKAVAESGKDIPVDNKSEGKENLMKASKFDKETKSIYSVK